MGEPVKISYLAEQMIRLANKVPGRDINVVYTGLRPGEKLFEELFHAQESYQGTRHAKIFLAQPRSMSWDLLQAQLRQALLAVRDYDQEALRRCLASLLPEFAERSTLDDAEVVPIVRSQA
jgi:FlaA1/EpsC-like NDP-sugar epimerase